jgi:tRNA G18 (ribose-2'-O)-methylase SpoU
MIASITDIVSLEQPGLEPYRTLRFTIEHHRQGIFVAEGNKVTRRLIACDMKICSVLLTDEWLAACRRDLERHPDPIAVFRASEELMSAIVGYRYHRGVMAVGRIPQTASLESVCATSAPSRLFVALDGLTSAENTGVIIRNCAACRVGAVIVGETSADPYLRRAVRNSMGTVFRLQIVRSDNLAFSLKTLREDYGFSVIAAHPRPGSVPLDEIDLTKDSCIVFGHEDDGVSEKIVAACTEVAAIPMAEGIDSFNVACASAIVLYEAFRQRIKRDKGALLPHKNELSL